MSLPIQVFWLMNGNIQRIQAERDLRFIENNSVAQSTEGFQKRHEALTLELGNIVTIDPAKKAMAEVRDEEGFNYLKGIN